MLTLVKRKGSPYWIARGTIKGRRVEESTRCRNKNEAKEVAYEIQQRETCDDIGSQGITFEQAAALYIEQVGSNRYLPKLVAHFADTPVSRINNAAMRNASNLLFSEAKPATIKRNLYTPVKAVINCAASEELCSPKILKAPKGGAKRTRFLTPQQVEKLILSASQTEGAYITAMITLFAGQGVRLSEATNLLWEDVSLDMQYAIIRDPKNGEERQINLLPRVVAALSVLPSIQFSEHVFLSNAGNPFKSSSRGAQKPFKRSVRAAMLPGWISAHILRHTWATWFYAQTKDVLRLKNEGGWKSDQWERYTKLAPHLIGVHALNHGWDFSELGENGGTINNYSAKTIA